MSLKEFSKTRWKLEANHITIYPHRLFYIMSIVLAIVFGGLFAFVFSNLQGATELPYWILTFVVFVAIFWSFGSTAIEFDNGAGVMRKKLMGFIPVKSIPFEKLHGVNVISNVGGGYTYRIFRKDNRYGKGLIISSGYSKNNDPNAQAFVNEAIPAIHNFLDQHGTLEAPVITPITSYKYFTQAGEKYIVKKSKIGFIIMGVFLLALGIHEITSVAWLDYNGSMSKIIILAFFFLGGGAILFLGFTNITIDTFARTIEKNSPMGVGNKVYTLQDFTGIKTVRKTVNLVYAGTEVYLYFNLPGKGKQEGLMLTSLKRSKDIERFVEEVNSIIKPAV